jgi:hypothetical protein
MSLAPIETGSLHTLSEKLEGKLSLLRQGYGGQGKNGPEVRRKKEKLRKGNQRAA